MSKFLAGVAGIAAGVVIYIILLVVSTWFQNLFPASSNGEEFAMPRGMAVYYVAVSIGSVAGLVAVFRTKMHAETRVLLISMCCVLVGLFALCDMFAVPSLFASRS